MGSRLIDTALHILILLLIGVVAIGSRLFSVLRYESIIHEFDPWFNYRATIQLVREGFFAFLDWFDETAWYPLGRVVGGTIFPGLMMTAALIEWLLRNVLLIPVDLRHICVFMAPAFSAITALATYGLTRVASEDIRQGAVGGLFAAMFVAIAPGYISRSVAGSYDNEAIAIPLLMATFYLWLTSLRSGSSLSALLCGLSYIYMVSAWGGYVFIINLIPLHVFVLLCMGRYTSRLYTAYSTFYVIGTMGSMLIPFVGVNPSRTSDHMAALGTFGLLQIVGLLASVRPHFKPDTFKALLGWLMVGLSALAFLGLFIFQDMIAPWTGRFYALWDTDFAKTHLPIVASVSEHQPTTWTSFFFDLHVLVILFPAGLYLLFRYPTVSEPGVFLILYALTGTYFAGVMVRLMLTLTPLVCILAGLAMSKLFHQYLYLGHQTEELSESIEKSSQGAHLPSFSSFEDLSRKTQFSLVPTVPLGPMMPTPFQASNKLTFLNRFILVSVMLFILFQFVRHCTWVTSTAYSSPSVVLSSYDQNGDPLIIDDFREAYSWIRHHAAPESKILSWWDYGYQIAGFCHTPEHPIITITVRIWLYFCYFL
jgi:dolichyl-diphosphooligosaccharide---protein glycosyltransferase